MIDNFSAQQSLVEIALLIARIGQHGVIVLQHVAQDLEHVIGIAQII